ncbi:MAG: anaerobic ribonucleoside-triphosphate reductase activating protein [Thermoguttaceae bacterium]|nr:anaerobic ribonucleoside-triphosphate reductase activating protein [Thermoguttaceae bacterium]
MLIKGLQKLTLLDYPGKMACTVFTAGCNFRCPFCHNASLVTNIDEERISEEDFFSFLQKRQGIIEGVCVTGGEPTLQPDLKEFLKKIKDLGYSVKLDTNGYRPEVLKDVVNSGLVDYVAMDIKNSQAKYASTCGLDNLDIAKINESVQFLMSVPSTCEKIAVFENKNKAPENKNTEENAAFENNRKCCEKTIEELKTAADAVVGSMKEAEDWL